MKIADHSAQMLNAYWEWGKHDCLTFVENCTGLKRPDWSCADTEEEARRQARVLGEGSEWVCVVQHLDENPSVERCNVMDLRVGDIAITPQHHWTFNRGVNRVVDGNNHWALGVVDESYQFITYCSGRIMNVSPVGISWRLK